MSSSHGSCSSLAGGASLAVGPDQYEPTQEYQEALCDMAMTEGSSCSTGTSRGSCSVSSWSGKSDASSAPEARDVVVEAGQAKKVPDVQAKCSFHSGRVAYGASLLRFSNHCRKQFSLMSACWNPACCNGHPRSKPCNHQLGHTARHHAPGELTDAWRFYDTPKRLPTERPAAIAVSVDCDMGTAVSGGSEVVRVSVMDYYNGRVLLDNLVCPGVPMAHYNASWSGVGFRGMGGARRARTCILGRENARYAV
ncbi:hypothetical protein S40293_10255 [Stachybotrys chartarum IBT 40293]|nr:hypothetical protein S40293_10255 [Stachybotrys chartarum IBT 40293]